MTRRTKAQIAQRDTAIDTLRALVTPGQTVYTSLKHVSRSGMLRHIDVYIIENNEPRRITNLVADSCDYRQASPFGPLKVGGCGMDMGFSVIYGLSRTLYPDGFECIGTDCPSNDHSNGDRNREPHHHSDGGYALWHHWM